MEGPLERKMAAANRFHSFTHDFSLVLYKQLIKSGYVLQLLPFSSVLGFSLYEDIDDGRAATHHLYSFAIEVWYAPMICIILSETGVLGYQTALRLEIGRIPAKS